MSSFLRADDAGEALPEDGDHGGGVVDREGGLRDVGEALRVARLEGAGVGGGLDQGGGAGRQLAERAHHLRVAGVADQDDLQAFFQVVAGFGVHLGDEGAGGVQVEHVAGLGPLGDRLGNAMC